MGLSSADICAAIKNIPNPKTFDDCYTYLSYSVENATHEKIKMAYGKKLLGRSQIVKMKKF